jgi:hypothetical protein
MISTLRPCAKSTSLGNSPNCCKCFGSDGSTMCVELKSMLLVFFYALVATISLVCQMWVDCLIPNSIETQDFDVDFEILQ